MNVKTLIKKLQDFATKHPDCLVNEVNYEIDMLDFDCCDDEGISDVITSEGNYPTVTIKIGIYQD